MLNELDVVPVVLEIDGDLLSITVIHRTGVTDGLAPITNTGTYATPINDLPEVWDVPSLIKDIEVLAQRIVDLYNTAPKKVEDLPEEEDDDDGDSICLRD